MIPDHMLAIRFSIAGQLLGARLDDPVVTEVDRPFAPRTRSWLAGVLHSAAHRVAPRITVPVAH